MKAKYKYYQVFEYLNVPEGEVDKRLIYTFDNEAAANEMVELIIRNDFIYPVIGVEEYETSA